MTDSKFNVFTCQTYVGKIASFFVDRPNDLLNFRKINTDCYCVIRDFRLDQKRKRHKSTIQKWRNFSKKSIIFGVTDTIKFIIQNLSWPHIFSSNGTKSRNGIKNIVPFCVNETSLLTLFNDTNNLATKSSRLETIKIVLNLFPKICRNTYVYEYCYTVPKGETEKIIDEVLTDFDEGLLETSTQNIVFTQRKLIKNNNEFIFKKEEIDNKIMYSFTYCSMHHD